MKRSQVSQAFSFLMAAIVVSLIIFVGFKGIGWILQSQCEQGKALFEKTLVDNLMQYSDRGTVHEEILAAPCDSTQICFVDSAYCPRETSTIPPIDFQGDNIIASSANDCSANIFIKGKYTEPLTIQANFLDKVSLSGEPFQCFDIRQGKVKLVFSGTGKRTVVSESGLVELPPDPIFYGDAPGAVPGGAHVPQPSVQACNNNGICEPRQGESASTCAADCLFSPPGKAIYFNPAKIAVMNGDSVTVELRGSQLVNVYGIEFTLSYNPGVLEFKSFEEGNWLNDNNQIPCAHSGEVGVLDLWCVRSNQPNGIFGSGVLAWITFKALATGETSLALSGVDMVDPNNVPLYVSKFDGKIIVS